jgi:hypothetical protein
MEKERMIEIEEVDLRIMRDFIFLMFLDWKRQIPGNIEVEETANMRKKLEKYFKGTFGDENGNWFADCCIYCVETANRKMEG